MIAPPPARGTAAFVPPVTAPSTVHPDAPIGMVRERGQATGTPVPAARPAARGARAERRRTAGPQADGGALPVRDPTRAGDGVRCRARWTREAAAGQTGPMDERWTLIRDWLGELLPSASPPDLEVAAADASFRRYLRVRVAGSTRVVMDAPPEHQDLDSFLEVRDRLANAGLTVPEVYASDRERGLLLLSDLGTRTYLEELDETRAAALYTDAIRALVVMQSQVGAGGLPACDAPFLERELALFETWFLRRHLGVRLTTGDRRVLEQCCRSLVAACLEQDRAFVHRDYHSRNLMVCPGRNPGILDFQDAVRGPIAYDVASLLRDVYLAWPEERVRAWVYQYHESARRAGLLPSTSPRTLCRWVDLAGVQRHLKIAGIFSRLCHRDAKPGYLKHLPLTLGYLRVVSARHPETERLGALFDALDLEARLEACSAAWIGRRGTPA